MFDVHAYMLVFVVFKNYKLLGYSYLLGDFAFS